MSLQRSWRTYLSTILSIILGLLVAFPLFYAIFAGFKTEGEFGAYPPTILPNSFAYLENFKEVLFHTMIPRFMLNSFMIAITITAVRLILSTLAAYALAFLNFPGRTFIFIFILGTMMIPSEALLISNFITVSKLHLLNTYLGIMIVSFVSATQVFMFRQSFKSISGTLREAAFLDGCGDFRFYAKICMPVSVPIITSLGLSSFVNVWNSYLWPLLVTTKEEMRTVQVGITLLSAHEGSNYALVFAGITIILIPSIIFFMFFQRNIIGGMFNGSVKG
ncbi:carbohydrate ABC transporter permease [Paenibacillus piri]|uniref:Carbohydrate ABC transporter permease n=1 Tax=Paenibacillus piri TaxID=2547395 RepID=A0A4R5KEV6_9BACL|nr:carbohydrate ABC transporter permease [Paenibacillus piri]TDF93803.1 carbohydrate ABC transporter permease [Paenibacillus piri]